VITEDPIDPPDEEGSVVESPWFWILISVGVLGAGAAIAGYLIWDGMQVDPETNRVYVL
jgi:type IV secretory pathway TrbF-like protein